MKKDKKKIIKRIFGWTSFGVGIFLSILLIVNSSLSGGISGMISRFILINTADALNPSHTAPTIPVTGADLKFYEGYTWNNVDGYEQNEIPVGCTKAIEFSVEPINATNTNFTYSCSKDDVVISRSGNVLYVQTMSTGDFVVEATSSDGGFKKSQEFKSVSLVAPQNFEIEEESVQIPWGESLDLNPVFAEEKMKESLMSVRYYDETKLTYTSSNQTIAEVNDYGVVVSKAIGTTTITMSNGTISKTFDVEVTPVEEIVDQTSFELVADKAELGIQDMDYDRSPKEGECFHAHIDVNWDGDPTDKSITFVSSDPLVAKVDQEGNVRGYRKYGNVVVTAFSNRNPSLTKSIEFEVKPVIITDFNISPGSLADLTNGTNRYIGPSYSPRNATDTSFQVETSDTNIIKATSAGRSINITGVAEGEATFSIYPTSNPELKKTFTIKIIKYSIANDEDFDEIHKTFRKLSGHFMAFVFTGLFTTLGLILLWSDIKKLKYFLYLIAATYGFTLAGLTEFIQIFVPERKGQFSDVMIDFGGYSIGFAVILIIYVTIDIVKLIIEKKRK